MILYVNVRANEIELVRWLSKKDCVVQSAKGTYRHGGSTSRGHILGVVWTVQTTEEVCSQNLINFCEDKVEKFVWEKETMDLGNKSPGGWCGRERPRKRGDE